MQYYFELRRSRTEWLAVCFMLGVAALVALVYLNPGLVQSIYLLAIAMLGIGEYRCASQMRVEYLILDRDRCGTASDPSQQPYFYYKYKVYPCRWFAILKLYDRHINRTEILFPDRFKSLQAYQQCRYLLTRLHDS